MMSIKSYKKAHSPILNIHLDAIFRNWQIFEQTTKGKTAAVVKADAYGLGAKPIALYLEKKGVGDFFVAHLEEATALREYGIQGNIYTLNGLNFDKPISDDILASYVKHRIIPVINSFKELDIFYHFLKKHHKTYPAILHVDTGMNRLGFPKEEWQQIHPHHPYFSLIKVEYIMSHLACADEQKNPYNLKQKQAFEKAIHMWEATPLSFANSAGIFLGDDYQGHLSRPGIGLYGGNPFSDIRPNPFESVIEILAPIIQIRSLKIGENTGYGCSWKAKRESHIATLSLGYADGISRHISNKGYGMLGGYKLPIIGRISMDTLTLDITDLPDNLKKIGQKVEILGKNITIDHMASWADTIAYEILTSLGHRYQRNYIKEKK